MEEKANKGTQSEGNEMLHLSEERPFSYDDLYGLSFGQFYRYELNDEIYIEGQVVSNDGVTAIIKVTFRYMECYFDILHYYEVRQFFPSFFDDEAQRLTEYLCIDIETECNLFSRDPDNNALMLQQYDENGNLSSTPADIFTVRAERLKKKLSHELKKIEDEEKRKRDSQTGPIVNIDLLDAAVHEMYVEHDHEIGIEDNNLDYSFNRSLHWLRHRNCAILTAWRGKYSRKENDERNQELQQSLRSFGYGVIRVRGCYAEMGRSAEKENSFLVFDLEDTPDFCDRIYEQSVRYEQDCFLYKPVEEEMAFLIGTNEAFGIDRIESAGVMRINSSESDNYSEIGTGRVSFENKTNN